MIIGITGTNSAGKGKIVEYLIQKKGFQYLSVRGFIEEEIERRGLIKSRESLQEVANDLRATYGPSYIVDSLYETAVKSKKNVIIESIRAIGEIDSLRKKGNFILFGIDADSKIRYERAKIRAGYTDKCSFEEFLADEQKEMSSQDPNKQNILVCMEMANYRFLNNGTIDDLFMDVGLALSEIKKPEDPEFRPSWDEYWMKLTAVVAKRSTCKRHHVGAIIVRDKQLLSTGYNGASRGLKDCLELGCLRDELGIPSGTRHEICRAAHAEQNAINQAAREGIELNGGTLYCTLNPCSICAKMIINTGIKNIVTYNESYPDDFAKKMLDEAKIPLKKILRPDKEIIFKD